MVACHRATEVRGIYVNQTGLGTFFLCDEPNTAVLVPDSGLAAKAFYDRLGYQHSGRRYTKVL
jgi:hypothetical protein